MFLLSAPFTYITPPDSASGFFHRKMFESFPMIDAPEPETKMTRLCFLFFGGQEVDELTKLDNAVNLGAVKVLNYMTDVNDSVDAYMDKGMRGSDEEEPDYGEEESEYGGENPEEEKEIPANNGESPVNNEENPYAIESSHGPVIIKAITEFIEGKLGDMLCSSLNTFCGLDPLMATASFSQIDNATGLQVDSRVAHLLLMDIPTSLLDQVTSRVAQCIRKKLDVGQFIEEDPQRLLPSAFAHFHIPIPDCLNEKML